MASTHDISKDAKTRMGKTIESLRHELSKLRTGRAHASLLDHVSVDYYGSTVPLSQVSTVNAEDARTLAVSPWEKKMVPVVEKGMAREARERYQTAGELAEDLRAFLQFAPVRARYRGRIDR